ncbi:hypothetical protein AB3X94_37420 [Paraburkholderia sp. BR10923]|uniref:hypothetical protein n=1 Tax=Paraburkholderia sp. BR10923 TaxID=3236992 RepID=UPI0034CD7E09
MKTRQADTLATLREQLRACSDAARGAALTALTFLEDGLALPTDRDELCALLDVTDYYRVKHWREFSRAIGLVQKIFHARKNFSDDGNSSQTQAQQGKAPDDSASQDDALLGFKGFSFNVLEKQETSTTEPTRQFPEAKQPGWSGIRDELRSMGVRLQWIPVRAIGMAWRDEVEQRLRPLAAELGIGFVELCRRVASEFKGMGRTYTSSALLGCWRAIVANIRAALRASKPVEPVPCDVPAVVPVVTPMRATASARISDLAAGCLAAARDAAKLAPRRLASSQLPTGLPTKSVDNVTA